MLNDYTLLYKAKKLTAVHQSNNNLNLCIDFFNPQLQWRLKTLNKKQIFAKSLGLHKTIKKPYVIDATAGLGHDALSMLKLGCRVTMIEASPLVFALLEDALLRAKQNPLNHTLAINQLSLVNDDSTSFLKQLKENEKPDIIYLDPMFPHRTKSAKIKHAMWALQHITQNHDPNLLCSTALKTAKHRVVVKRAKQAPHLTSHQPTIIYYGKSIRYDVYVCNNNN